MNKVTSGRVATIAGSLLNLTISTLRSRANGIDTAPVLLDEIHTIAGSAISQDEQSGHLTVSDKIPENGIHPAPVEFSAAQISVDPILHFFHYAHLPPKLQATSRLFFVLAANCVNTLPRNPERTVALRKLLEAKDAAVRANLPAPGFDQQDTTRSLQNSARGSVVASKREQPIGEPVEVGGHDEDRDGPIPFDN
jgi:hypothetical protein